MEKTLVKGVFQTTNGLIMIVKNDRVYKVGDTFQTEAGLHRITGVIPSCNPTVANRISLKIEKA